jgi:hypothetical protein
VLTVGAGCTFDASREFDAATDAVSVTPDGVTLDSFPNFDISTDASEETGVDANDDDDTAAETGEEPDDAGVDAPCDDSNGGCAQNCHNTVPDFYCSCNDGYTLNEGGLACDDVIECDDANGGCETNCHNTIGDFYCSCDGGYELNEDDLACDNINECDSFDCGTTGSCEDTEGSYECTCGTGYSNATVGNLTTACVFTGYDITGTLAVDDAGEWADGTYAASCRDYLVPTTGYLYEGSTGDGYYTVQPDTTPFVVYCDMTFDDGGWTLIRSTDGGTDARTTTEGTVTVGSMTHLALTDMQDLADISEQVHIRTTGNAATESVTTIPDTLPLENLRDGIMLHWGSWSIDHWSGPLATNYYLGFSCANWNDTWPAIYQTCGRQGIHLARQHSRWEWQSGNTSLNLAMEVYVRSCPDPVGDQCDTDNGGCDTTCTPICGGYVCSCADGFELDGDEHTCVEL